MRFDNISMNGPLLGNSATIASASTTDLSTVAGNAVSVSGTTTIDSFGTVQAGAVFNLTFQDVLVLTYNAGSMILPGNASITTAAGDVAVLESLGSGNWKCTGYQRQGVPPMAGGYNTVTKSQFDALVAASGLAPGEWYYVQAAYTNSAYGDMDALVVAAGVATIDFNLIWVKDQGGTLYSYVPAKAGAIDLSDTQIVGGYVRLTSAQALALTSGFLPGMQVVIEFGGDQYWANLVNDGSAVGNCAIKAGPGGLNFTTGKLSNALDDFYPNSGQYAPTVTPTGFDATTNVKSSYMVQGNIIHTMHTIDVNNTSAATFGRIRITAPDGFAIENSDPNSVIGTFSFSQPKEYPNTDLVEITNSGGDIYIEITFSTPPTAFQISLSCQSKLA